MKKNGDELGIISKICIFVGLFILILLWPNVLQVGQAFHSTQATYVSAGIFIVGYILIGVLAWFILKPNFYQAQFKKFTSEQVNTLFKAYGLILVMNFTFNFIMNQFFNTTNTANQENIKSILSLNSTVLIVFSLSAVLIAPFVEEFIFRGIVINYFFKHSSWWINIILSGLLFSLGHASQNIISFALYATMGMILAYVYKSSGQIKMSIAVHMLNNGVAMVLTVLGILLN